MINYALEGPKWATPVVTWSFAAAGGVFSSSIGAAYQGLVQQAVARWDSVAAVTLQQVPDSAAADIRIGFAQFGTTSSQIGLTSYSYQPGTTMTFMPGIAVEIEDPAQHTVSGASGTPIYTATQTSMYQVILHELGHALGLDHSQDPNAVMYAVGSAANRDLDASDLAGIQALYGASGLAMTNTTTGVSGQADTTAYSGPVSYLQQQYIYYGSDSLAINTSTPNVFIHTGSGNDAITVASGRNVLDAGQGSNFLTGGTGNDTFYVDGRGGQVSWGTIINFHAGDAVTLWGFTPTTRSIWVDGEGASGYTGRTLHADLTGGGMVTTSVTFAGMSAADAASLVITTGTVGGNPYLAITKPA